MTERPDPGRSGSSGSSSLDQDDVLRKKGATTQGALGLQKWDADEDETAVGTASSGTAARAAKIAAGQKKQADAREEPR